MFNSSRNEKIIYFRSTGKLKAVQCITKHLFYATFIYFTFFIFIISFDLYIQVVGYHHTTERPICLRIKYLKQDCESLCAFFLI